MKTNHISIIIAIAGIAAVGFLYFSLWQIDNRDTISQDLKEPWKERVIQNLTETVMSNITHYDKLDAIQKAVSQTNLGEFSHIVISNLKNDYSDGEKIKFDLTIFGYHNWCLFPHLSVYHEKYDKPIWESGVGGMCPPPVEVSYPRVSNWKSVDFNQFPSCRYEGKHTIFGESFEFGPKAVGQYYCHGAKKFQPPKTIQMSIPYGASDHVQKRNFEPTEINAMWGDYINFTNNDHVAHDVIVKYDRTNQIEFFAALEPGKSFQMKVLNNKTKWVFSETNGKRFEWMKGIIHAN